MVLMIVSANKLWLSWFDHRQVLEQLRGRVVGEEPRLIIVEKPGGPRLPRGDPGFGVVMDGFFGGPDADAFGDQHLS